MCEHALIYCYYLTWRMREFEATFLPDNISEKGLKHVSSFLDLQQEQQIDHLLWSDTGYKPQVGFAMAYNDKGIFIKFSVQERFVKAVYREINEPVYKDSCVEMFIAFNGDDNYYNLEFNCLGTALVGYGSGKHDRINLQKQFIKKIKSVHHLKTDINSDEMPIKWHLVLYIPYDVFVHHHINTLTGNKCRANFYKCGDDLPEPHFLSWNNIESLTPNFHLSEFFGLVKFT